MTRTARASYLHETERVARHLGLPAYGPGADSAIVDYCRDEVARLAGGHGLPRTMDQLLTQVATCLSVEFFEVHSDDDLTRLRDKFPPDKEPAILQVLYELEGDVDAITIRRKCPEPWDCRYLAVINCRGKHYYRRYFTKWHELTHLLLEGEQLTLAFRTTTTERPDPGEVLVDKVAAVLAFLPDIVGPHAARCLQQLGLTFEAVDTLRTAVAPEASRHASALALITHAERPAWHLRCKTSLKPKEKRSLSDPNAPTATLEPKLRVIEASPNQAAKDSGIRVHPWMRVPESGIIAQSKEFMRDLSGIEPLNSWVTSTSGPIGEGLLYVDCIVSGEQVLALASLADS